MTVIDVSELEALGGSLTEKAGGIGAKAAAALRKTAYDIEADAKGLVRVDTGFLKGSISTSFEGDGRFASLTAEVGPTADYGIWQEIGTSVMAGKPYMAPAFDRRYPNFEKAIGALGIEIIR
jgi:hypothetical protein